MIFCNQVIHFSPEDSWGYYVRNCARQKLGRLMDAMLGYESALDLEPDFIEARNSLTSAQREMRENRDSSGEENNS